MNKIEVLKLARDYTNTSVEDMNSSLNCAELNGELHLDVLKKALEITSKRGEKTKANIIKRYIKKLEAQTDDATVAARRDELIKSLLGELEYYAKIVTNIANNRDDIELRDSARMVTQCTTLIKFQLEQKAAG